MYCVDILETDFFAFVHNLNNDFMKLRIDRLLLQHEAMMDGNSTAETAEATTENLQI